MDESRTILAPHLASVAKRRVMNDGDELDTWIPCLHYRNQSGFRIPIVGKNELLVITGGKKSRKSLLINVFAASRYEELTNPEWTLGFELSMPQPILYFDTEQHRWRVKKNRTRYQQMIGEPDSDDQNFIQYALQGLSAHQIIEAIDMTIREMVDAGTPPGVIIIDQILDLVPGRDENDKAASSEVLDWINTWKDLTGALMVVSIHTNRSELHTTGRMGTLLDQKADSTLKLAIDDSWITELSHMFSREKRMPKIRFTQGFDGMPQFINEELETGR